MTGNRDPRLLFVMSNDYGELGNARYILYGQDRLLANASLLLPERLHARNKRLFGCATQEYSTAEHILQQIKSQKPDIVFLFSGYLFAWDGLLTVDSIAEIVQWSKVHDFKLVTSDPYMGLLANPVPKITDAHSSFQTLFDIFRGVKHFYPVPCEQLAPSCGIRELSTFNPNLVDDRHQADGGPLFAAPIAADGKPEPTWLFILGTNDFDVQTSRYGRDLFISKLAEKFRNAQSVGRKPVLIAPDRCNQAMRAKLGGDQDRVGLISFCGYDDFTELLLGAEAAFYWNVISNSMFHRILNRLPNFYFDAGHLGRIQAIYELAVSNYFAGWEPVCLDNQQPLNLEVLRIVQGVFKSDVERMREKYCSAPSPSELVSAILSDRQSLG